MRRPSLLLVIALLTAVTACASSGASSANANGATTGSARRSSNSNVLTADDLSRAAQLNVRDVIYALRPRWLQNNSAGSLSSMGANAPVAVFVNGRPAGGLEALTSFQKHSVARINYYTVSEAQSRYGSSVRGPVIDVRLATGG